MLLQVRRQRRIEKKVEAMRAQGKDEDEIREAIANIKQRGVDDRDVVIPQVDKYVFHSPSKVPPSLNHMPHLCVFSTTQVR